MFPSEREGVFLRSLKPHIPNCITILRIIGSLILLFLDPHNSAFLIVYSFCGITDVLDGTLARLLKVTSSQGAVLDTISDLFFYCVMLSRVLPLAWSEFQTLTLALIAFAVTLRIIVYLVAYFKFNVFSSLHTYGNKFTGFCVFLFPYVVLLFNWNTNTFCQIVAVIGTLVTLEELLIHLTSPKYSPWRKTIFSLTEPK